MNIKTNIMILSVLCLFLANPVYSSPPMTLEDAIKIGLENNFDIKIARNNAKIASNNAGYGTAGLLPTVNVNSVSMPRENNRGRNIV